MHLNNSLNIFSYFLIVAAMITTIALAAENISNYINSTDGEEKTEISIVLLSSSLFITVAFFCVFGIYILFKAGKDSIYSIESSIKNKFLIINAIIFSFSLLIFLPAISLASDTNSSNFSIVLITGGILSLVTSFVNTCLMLKV